MDWIKVDDIHNKPKENKTYWVTLEICEGIVIEAIYKKGKWYEDSWNRSEHILDNVYAWYPLEKPEPFKIPKKEGFKFPEFKTNKKGLNKKIKINLLSEENMRKNGFTDHYLPNWYYCKRLNNSISFSISIPKENKDDFSIDILDEDFGQPYDYQSMLMENKDNKFAKNIMEKVEKEMDKLKKIGILSGHIKGEYI